MQKSAVPRHRYSAAYVGMPKTAKILVMADCGGYKICTYVLAII